MKYSTVALFIPEKACPFRCVYCNQYTISSRTASITPAELPTVIEQQLATMDSQNERTIAFFGGSFTGMSIKEQNAYLDIAAQYVQQGKAEKIQLSTRPDYINEAILDNLKAKQVKVIELGAQSFDASVLKQAGRGHDVEAIEKASKLIKDYGFSLGLQMMIGLPGDSKDKAIAGAKKIIALGADNTRIYPTLVLKNTRLELLYRQKCYQPLSIEEAVDWCKDLYLLFLNNNVTVLRLGLHPSEQLTKGKNLIAGPFHPSFKELVLTALWHDTLSPLMNEKAQQLVLRVHPKDFNAAIGYRAKNKKMLQQNYREVHFVKDETIQKMTFK